VACGPPGLKGGKNILVSQQWRRHFHQASTSSGISQANGTYGLGVLTADFDKRWLARQSTSPMTPRPAHSTKTKETGRFTDIALEAGLRSEAPMENRRPYGRLGRRLRHGRQLRIVKTTRGDTPSLYRIRVEQTLKTPPSLLAWASTRSISGGDAVFFRTMDNDGWPDILICNGHVYPEVEQLKTGGWLSAQRKLLYRNLRNGRFEDVSLQAGAGNSIRSLPRSRLLAILTTTETWMSW